MTRGIGRRAPLSILSLAMFLSGGTASAAPPSLAATPAAAAGTGMAQLKPGDLVRVEYVKAPEGNVVKTIELLPSPPRRVSDETPAAVARHRPDPARGGLREATGARRTAPRPRRGPARPV